MNNYRDSYDKETISSNCRKFIKITGYDNDIINYIVSNRLFKNNYKDTSKKTFDINQLETSFIKPLISDYKETHIDAKEIFYFINSLFDTLNDGLWLKGKELVNSNNKRRDVLKENNFIISTNDLNFSQKNKVLIKTLDPSLTKSTDKQQSIQNTIDLIKEQKIQLQNDNTKLQKAATLLILLEAYKVNIDNTNKFNSLNEVYKILNDTVKKKIKNVNLTEADVKLREVIDEVNKVLNKKGKENISSDISITF